MRCDRCGEPGAKHYTISDGETTWQVDLDDTHAKALLQAAHWGRQVSTTGQRATSSAARVLDSRVRHPPEAPHYNSNGPGREGRS